MLFAMPTSALAADPVTITTKPNAKSSSIFPMIKWRTSEGWNVTHLEFSRSPKLKGGVLAKPGITLETSSTQGDVTRHWDDTRLWARSIRSFSNEGATYAGRWYYQATALQQCEDDEDCAQFVTPVRAINIRKVVSVQSLSLRFEDEEIDSMTIKVRMVTTLPKIPFSLIMRMNGKLICNYRSGMVSNLDLGSPGVVEASVFCTFPLKYQLGGGRDKFSGKMAVGSKATTGKKAVVGF